MGDFIPMTNNDFPLLFTNRINLRGFTKRDAPRVAVLCGEWDIAASTANIPHPYTTSMADDWIGGHQESDEAGNAVSFAVTTIENELLIGAIGLHINQSNFLAEIGYWIGRPYWNSGYASEAAIKVIEYGFEQRSLNRIQARHMTKNPVSGRVMEKAGRKGPPYR